MAGREVAGLVEVMDIGRNYVAEEAVEGPGTRIGAYMVGSVEATPPGGFRLLLKSNSQKPQKHV